MTKRHSLQGERRRDAVAAYMTAFRKETGRDPSRAQIAQAVGVPDSGALGRMILDLRGTGRIKSLPASRTTINDGHGGLLVERIDDKGTIAIHQNPDGNGNSVVIPAGCYRSVMSALHRASPFRNHD